MNSMSNEEMIIKIKEGNKELIYNLWEQNVGLTYSFAKRYYNPADGQRMTSIDDLMQSAFIGFHEAIYAFDSERAAKFSTFFPYYVKNACREEIGLRSSKGQSDKYAISFDAPLDEDESFSLIDTLEDKDTINYIYSLERDCLYDNVNSALDRLEPKYKEAVVDYYAGAGKPVERKALDKALRLLRSDRKLRKAYYDWKADELTGFHWHKGLSVYKVTMTSAVEDIAEYREKIFSSLED